MVGLAKVAFNFCVGCSVTPDLHGLRNDCFRKSVFLDHVGRLLVFGDDLIGAQAVARDIA